MIINKIFCYIERIISFIKIFFYKIIYYKKIIFNNFPIFKFNTKLYISSNGQLNIGKVCFFDNCNLSVVDGNLTIGSNVAFNRNNIIVCHNSIIIEDDCIFGPNVMIYDHDHKFNKNGISRTNFNLGNIIIEKGCWIGAGCIILKNTVIGEGSVIGAGCILKGKIPPHSLVTSNRELKISTLN